MGFPGVIVVGLKPATSQPDSCFSAALTTLRRLKLDSILHTFGLLTRHPCREYQNGPRSHPGRERLDFCRRPRVPFPPMPEQTALDPTRTYPGAATPDARLRASTGERTTALADLTNPPIVRTWLLYPGDGPLQPRKLA